MIKYIFYLPLTVWKWFWSVIWNISEYTGVGLGRLAPWIFHQMIGSSKYRKVK